MYRNLMPVRCIISLCKESDCLKSLVLQTCTLFRWIFNWINVIYALLFLYNKIAYDSSLRTSTLSTDYRWETPFNMTQTANINLFLYTVSITIQSILPHKLYPHLTLSISDCIVNSWDQCQTPHPPIRQRAKRTFLGIVNILVALMYVYVIHVYT